MSDELKPVVIEQTRKRYKAVIAIGSVLMLIAPVACAAGRFDAEAMRTGIALFLAGLTVYLVGKGLAWWKHG